ncbi:MAG TPA: hypothetical protein VKU36_03765 [Candidatus Babeliales bacterium]|nr:hypothetical protein [Candidatus Babeliales bacterium]
MKLKNLSILALMIILTSLTYTKQRVASCFIPRSISRDAARDLAGWTNYINKDSSRDTVYGALSVTPEYSQTFHDSRITQTLFGDNLTGSGCNQHLTISGSQVNNRGPHDLLADYFYLPSDFESIVRFNPTIDNVILDFGFYLGLDAWTKGLYFWIHVPFAHTRWDLNIKETIINAGINNAPQGYYTPDVLPRNLLLDSFTAFVNGVSVPNTENIAFEELKFAKMSNERLIKSRVAEVRTGIGWNFFAEKVYHFGFNGQLAAPTGLRPDGLFLFEPIVGNGHFWELGFGLNGHYNFWRNEDETAHCSFYTDINITHMFRTRQARSFDLIKAGTLSRYMLAMEMTSPAVNLQGPANTPPLIPSAQFDNDYLPLANITTLDVEVSIAVQADIVLLFNATKNNLSFDFGYNYWGRSNDAITVRRNESFDEQRFALKGDAHIFGFLPESTSSVALSATENKATIHTGTNMPATGSSDPAVIIAASKNPNIDFPEPAATNPPAPQIPQNLLYAQNLSDVPANSINTSIPPLFITRHDLDIEGAQTGGSSNKLFTHLAYTWNEKTEWQPYLGIGGEVEWASRTQKNCKPFLRQAQDCREHVPQCGTSQWGVWIKTGATFN